MSRGHAIVALLFVVASASAQYNPVATLYSGSGCTGSFLTLPGFISDLADHGFDNRATSARIRGPWLFFDLDSFNLAREARAEYAYESAENCVDLYYRDITTSVKFAGPSSDYRADSITFYEYTYFQATEEFVTLDTPYLYLEGRIASLIVTGTSAWTIYFEPNYGGDAICLQVMPSPNIDPAFVTDTILLDPTVPHGAIKSVRKGCITRDKVVTIGGNNTSIHQTKLESNTSFNL